MFRETLLESAPVTRRRKRWPVILAVALEVTVCSLLVALPLVTTGVIPIAARTVIACPQFKPMPIVDSRPVGHDGGRDPAMPRPSVVPIVDGQSVITFGHSVAGSNDDSVLPPNFDARPNGRAIPICDACTTRPRGSDHGPYPISDFTEGYLLHRVEPVYPRPAILAGIRGEVRLHAIISKDGTIESLTVISGSPLLVTAAVDAVQQWRYRPYLLNHEPVEVETFITVNFTPAK